MIIDNFYCVIDTETGGLFPEFFPKGSSEPAQSPVCEIAFVILDMHFKEVDRYQRIIKPYGSNPIYNPKAMETHGITMKEINNGMPIDKSLAEMDAILSKYSKGRGGKVLLVGHNMKFDYGMMKYAYDYCKRDIHKYTDEDLICTARLARLLWGHDGSMENFKLPTCCERIGINISDSHRALGDVLSTAKLLEHQVKESRGGGGTVVKKVVSEYERPIEFKF